MGADITQLDAYKSGVASDRIPLFHMQETLVAVDDDSNFVPMLAGKWEVLDNGATYRFYLRKGVKFHNGKEMTAEDIEYSLKRYMQVSPRKGEFPIKDFVTEDPYTIKLVLDKPSGGFLAALANPFYPAVIMPKGMVEEQGGTVKNPIGTGPYQFVEWVPGQSMTMKKFPDYSPVDGNLSGLGGKKIAYADRIVLRIMTDPAVRINALQSGEVNFITDVAANQFKGFENNNKIQTYNVPSLSWGMIEFGAKKPPFNNVLMRQAAAYAINTKEITNVAFYGLAKEATSPVSPLLKNWFTDVHKTPNEYNPEKAKELLKQAGYNGEKIVISASKAYQHHERSAVTLQQELKAVGMNVEIEWLDWPTWLSTRRNTGDFNILITHNTPRPDPTSVYRTELYGKSNVNGFNFPEIDSLLDKAATSIDQQERVNLVGQIQKLVSDQKPFISTYALPGLEASQGIDGYKGWSYNYPRFWNVWLKNKQ
ncbi:ABC transporter substrate-binding protein [Paenibacillus filicis]|uniref:ABC transporter substrate-binding protein n=1 Tax=Paenibacillus gyeongsangnamensis TaxID=3388067 RepID=A0ABT4Q408_9BACL|nr:ABC transporter substrate-binding protein [Paenibacillus filicis]MCZ8511522.1 ABC transporter substrate-binding protein [Paenibacillus filicis]